MGYLKWWCLLGFLSLASAEILVLDVNSDETKEWFGITCLYNEDHFDFSHYGCPANTLPGENVYPARKGFWSPCDAQVCEIHYFAGNRAPRPKKITLGMYVSGSPEVLVSSKYGPLDPNYKQVGKASFREDRGWYNATIDLNEEPRSLQLKMTLVTDSMRKDVLVLDHIVIDLGDNEELPTDPPSTTTEIPIKDDLVTLDKDSDSWVVWKHDCGYVDNLSDMWMYGCGNYDNVDTNGSTGFWGSCEKHNCSVRYVAKPDVILQPAVSVATIRAFVTEDAQVNLKLKTSLLDVFCKHCQPLGSLNTTGKSGWIEESIDLGLIRTNNFVLVFELLNGVQGGKAILDKVEVKLRSQQPPDEGNDGKRDEDNNSGNIFKIDQHSLWLSLIGFMLINFNLH